MSLRERQPYMEESERLKHLHARQYPTYKVFIRDRLIEFIRIFFSINHENEIRLIKSQLHLHIRLQLLLHHHHQYPRQI